MRLFRGQRAWLVQRISALLVLALLAAGGLALLLGPPLDHARWHALATGVHGGPLIMLLFAALCAHAWVGMRDIVLDYVQPRALRLSVLTLVALVLFAVLVRVLLTLAAHFAPPG
ncbi:succinate dehydrogenase, hydrophobic membrane anchor protein [Thauera butanivorans]|uniref:succinate dehydrogenase, hydrophobic membrane anchor protein n=1 Tax=Thauera butanivorans TaxID=86174 RepID=UPI000838E606|nr:succinate dehydrogenase, hydrophobic membrane anchor protein [Thauera butanivorans]